MGDQEQGMEKVMSCGGRRRKGGLSIIPVNGGCGVGVGVLVFAAAAAAIGASVVRARRAHREDRTTKKSFDDDVDSERIEGVKEEEEAKEGEENVSILSQRREEMGEETEEISFQIDRENQCSIEKLDLIPRREDTEIVVATREEEIILKANNDGNYDRGNSEESKVTPTEVKVYKETNDEEEEDEKEEKREDSTENEKAECELSVEFAATTELSTEETVDGSNDDSRASLIESGVFEAVAEAMDSTSKTEENDFSTKKREVEWKLEDDVHKVSRGEPKKIEMTNTTEAIAVEENEIGFAIANRSKGGLLLISAFVLAIVLLLLARRDRPGVFELSTM